LCPPTLPAHSPRSPFRPAPRYAHLPARRCEGDGFPPQPLRPHTEYESAPAASLPLAKRVTRAAPLIPDKAARADIDPAKAPSSSPRYELLLRQDSLGSAMQPACPALPVPRPWSLLRAVW